VTDSAAALAALLRESRRAVVFTGAGISTESSSLGVYPAAGFPLLAKRNGARLAIVNREETPQDRFADLVINAEIGPTMRAVIEVL